MNIPPRLSVSSLNTWRRNPLFWVSKYCLGFRDEAGENALRGTYAEEAVNAWVMLGQEDSYELLQTLGMQQYEIYCAAALELDGVTEPKYSYEQFQMFVDAAADGVAQIGAVTEMQTKIEIEICGYPMIGYIDYEFEGGFCDLKTSTRMPTRISTISNDHMRQLSAYNVALGGTGDVWIVYAGQSKQGYKNARRIFKPSDEPERLDAAWESLERDAASLLNFAEKFDTAEEAVQVLPATTEAYYKEPELVAFLQETLNASAS